MSKMKLVILITSELTNGLDIANGWAEAGAPGVTIIPAHGLQSIKQAAQDGQVELPRMRHSFGRAVASVLQNMTPRSEVVLAVVPEALVNQLIEKSETFLKLNEPNQGILFTLDVEQAIGIHRHTDDEV